MKKEDIKIETIQLASFEFPFSKLEQTILDQVELYCKKKQWELIEIVSVRFDYTYNLLFVEPYIEVTFERAI